MCTQLFDPKVDYIFKNIFGNENHPKILISFLNDPNNEKLIELEAKYEELHEAKVELARLSRDPKEAEKYRMRENAINERRNFFLETLDKGLKEGEKKAKIKIALKLKESLDINTISEMTDLSVSELEEIFSGKTI